MKTLTLKKREVLGKKSKSLRLQGIVPAAYYGPKQESVSVEVDAKDLMTVFKSAGFSSLIDVDVNGKHGKGIIKHLDLNHITRKPIHVSVYAVDMDTEITAEVPVEIIGVSPAVKNNLGFLEVSANSLTIKCLPAKLPAKLTVDISTLEKVGDMITVAELKLDSEVKIVGDDGDKTRIVFIAEPQKIVEEEVAAPTAEAATDAAAAAPEAEKKAA